MNKSHCKLLVEESVVEESGAGGGGGAVTGFSKLYLSCTDMCIALDNIVELLCLNNDIFCLFKAQNKV